MQFLSVTVRAITYFSSQREWYSLKATMLPRIFQIVLLDDGVRLNKWLDERPLSINEEHKGLTPIFFAVQHNSEISLPILIERGANLEFVVDYQNPLAYAVRYGSLVSVNEFLKAKVKFQNVPSPLETILYFDDIEKFKLVSEYYPDILTNKAKFGIFENHPLYLAIQAKATKCLIYILMNNPTFDTIFSYCGYDSLELAVSLLNFEAVSKIASLKGFKHYLNDHTQKCFLHEAAKTKPFGITDVVNKEKIIEQLLTFIENPNQKDKHGNTPLHMVTDVRTARQLVAGGCDLFQRNECGYLPKDCVEIFDRNNEDLIQWFVLKKELYEQSPQDNFN